MGSEVPNESSHIYPQSIFLEDRSCENSEEPKSRGNSFGGSKPNITPKIKAWSKPEDIPRIFC